VVNDEQSIKHVFPKDSTEPRKILDARILHPGEQPSGTLCTVPINSTVVNDEQSFKHSLSNDSIAPRKIMDVSELHSEKQPSGTLWTVSGYSNVVKGV
jgi:hypothetical protein